MGASLFSRGVVGKNVPPRLKQQMGLGGVSNGSQMCFRCVWMGSSDGFEMGFRWVSDGF